MRKVYMSVWGGVVCAVASLASGQECYQPVQSFSPLTGGRFGEAMDVQGDRALISKGTTTGSAARGFIYERVMNSWIERAALTPPSSPQSSAYSAALDGDVAVLGARDARPTGISFSGEVNVFRRQSETNWSHEVRLTNNPPVENERFGYAVAIHNNVIAVGAPGNGILQNWPGTVYIYHYLEGSWQFQQALANPNPTPDGQFGWSLCFSNDRLVVGARGWSDGSQFGGAVFVYQYNGTSWVLETTIHATGLELNDSFGSSVVSDGNTIVVGATGDDDVAQTAGALYVFEESAPSTWTQVAKLTVADGRIRDAIGQSVDIQNNLIVAGDPSREVVEEFTGAAHVFEFDGANWNYSSTIWPDSFGFLHYFGRSVAIAGSQILIGVPGSDDFGANLGAVHAYEVQSVAGDDCNANGIPDQCELIADCNNNGVQDICDIASGTPGFGDCDGDLILDICEILSGEDDCNENLIPDSCELNSLDATDCNSNGVLDECDLASGGEDCNNNKILDSCEVDDYLIDTSTSTSFWVITVPADALYLNHFVVQPQREWVNHIVIYLVDSTPATKSITILIYDDVNNDGDPEDGKLIYQSSVAVPHVAGPFRFPIPPTHVGNPGDSFFVGIKATVNGSQAEFPMLADANSIALADSWWGVGSQGEVNIETLSGFSIVPLTSQLDYADGQLIGVYVIRADATHYEGVPIECMCPGDLVMGTKFGADGSIDTADLMELLSNWGDCGEPCAPFCEGDINSAHGLPDCKVDVYDLFALLAAWGACD